MKDLDLVQARLGSEVLEHVWELYRKNAGTLGFLPRGALEEFAHAGCVLAATSSERVVGYLAWRRSRGEIVIVHLCVAEEHRGTNCSEALLNWLVDECKSDAAIRLRCRKDYAEANRLWPRYGFVMVGEAVGRGADAEPLYRWRRANENDAPLLQAINQASLRAARVVAIDANVFFDIMNPDAAHYQESSALLADWIDDVEICVTCEIRNEISRNEDQKVRQRASIYIGRFREIAAPSEGLRRAVHEISICLPEPHTESDHSDRRQLAHAWRGGATFFATRDSVLLDHADELRAITGLIILRPSDVVARLEGDTIGTDYAPVRLHGTKIERKAPSTEVELYPFQLFSAYEEKSAWLALIRTAMTSPRVFSIELLGERGLAPRIAVATDKSLPDQVRIHFLRALSGQLTGTLLRRVIADVVESARHDGRLRVTFAGELSKEVELAFDDLDFYHATDGSLVREIVPRVINSDFVKEEIGKCTMNAEDLASTDAVGLETRYWPLKVLGASIACYIVPIIPYWAAALFDRKLANQDLFGVPEYPALGLENVYYSASNVVIPKHSRIVWYVSGQVGEVRAVSTCLGTDIDTATSLSRRYHRLGAYKWSEILAAAKGDAGRKLHAYRFSRTELVVEPVAWNEIQEKMSLYHGSKNYLQSPVKISEQLFEDIYRRSMSIAQ